MSAYQIAIRKYGAVGFDVARLSERFYLWWISLYANPPRDLPPMI